MEVVHKSKKTIASEVKKLSGKDGLGLLHIINQLQIVNGALPETIARWTAKNAKSLTAQNKKWNADISVVNEKYVEKAPKGKAGFLYAQRGIETIKEGDTILRGDVGYPNPQDPRALLSIFTNKPIQLPQTHVDAGIPFEVKMKEDGTEEAYLAEHKVVEENEYDTMVYKINASIFDSLKVAIPTVDKEGNALQLSILYDNLIVDEEEETDKK